MNDSPSTDTVAEEASGPLCGERLRAARRELEISIGDIAKELHLDEPKVRALEQNNFELLGAPVFAKGHMRKYAELVGVDPEDMLADYYQLNRSTGAPPVVGPIKKMPSEISLGPWIAGLIVVLVVGVAAYLWFSREPVEPNANQIEPATLAPFVADSVVDPAEDSPALEDSPLVAESGTTSANSDNAVENAENSDLESSQAETATVPPGPASGDSLLAEPVQQQLQNNRESLLPQVSVELTYSGDCWTEISDASGRQLFYDLGSAGRVVPLSGDAPLRIVFGDSRNVSITVEGRAYPIPDSARSGRLARLTINRP